MCLATDASLTADPGVVSLIPVRSNTFVEIDCEIISKVILLPSAESFKKDCCQLQAKALSQAFPVKSVVRWTDCFNMTIAVDWDIKNQIKQNQTNHIGLVVGKPVAKVCDHLMPKPTC